MLNLEVNWQFSRLFQNDTVLSTTVVWYLICISRVFSFSFKLCYKDTQVFAVMVPS